jgi:hypothetical protein
MREATVTRKRVQRADDPPVLVQSRTARRLCRMFAIARILGPIHGLWSMTTVRLLTPAPSGG